jgi:beta-N-acetylhexosaminidase
MIREIIGQHLMIGLSGATLTTEEKNFIAKYQVSGVSLFDRNLRDPKQIQELCRELQSLAKQSTPLFIGIDMEGGRVHRLKAPFTKWPALAKVGAINSPKLSFAFAHSMGQELAAVGLNLNYAPCLDTLTNPQNKVIGDRAISDKPEQVEKHVSALIRGYLKANIIPCVKHFPGHGNTFVDSHEDLPIEYTRREQLESRELIPFKKAVRSRVGLIMTAHILFKEIDPEWPVTLSDIFLKEILRTNLKYQGLIMTDDLGMKALSAKYDQRLIPVRALQAGCDLLLYCNEPDGPPMAADAIEKALVDGLLRESDLRRSFQRITDFKKDNLKTKSGVDQAASLEIIGNSNHLDLAQSINEGIMPELLLTDET